MARKSTVLSLPVLALGAGALYFLTRKKTPAAPLLNPDGTTAGPAGALLDSLNPPKGWGVGAAPASQPVIVDGSEQAWNSIKMSTPFFLFGLLTAGVGAAALGATPRGRARLKREFRRRPFFKLVGGGSVPDIVGMVLLGNALTWKILNIGIPVGRRTTGS